MYSVCKFPFIFNKITTIQKYICYILCIIFNIYHCIVFAVVYTLPNNNDKLIGKNIEITIPNNNIHSLEYFAAQHQVGMSNILAANPGTDVYLPESKKKLIIPHQLILPNNSRSGIVINSAEMRLYYYPKNNNTVIVLPVAIGTIENPTPSNWITKIKYKKKPNLDPY